MIAEARQLDLKVAACVPFVYVEGPHISPRDGYRGAHPADAVRPPSITEFDRWQDAAGGIVRMVTMSPHFSKSAEYIAALVKRGVHVAIGHTRASPEQIRCAVDAGARLSTHLGNGIAQKISPGPRRRILHPGHRSEIQKRPNPSSRIVISQNSTGGQPRAPVRPRKRPAGVSGMLRRPAGEAVQKLRTAVPPATEVLKPQDGPPPPL
jgi:hypothetical protein